MMTIHGLLPGLLSILLILHTHPFIHALPSKTPIDVDISGQKPIRVKVIPSKAYPGGIHYIVQKNSMHAHVIGRVRDGDEILVDGDPTAITRYILVHPRGDGMKYIRVITRWRIDRKYTSHVDEFVKRPEDGHYAPIIRTPIEVNLVTQETNHHINVEIISEENDHPSKVFTIQPGMVLHATIGVVKYRGHILEDRVEGLMERTVIWVGGLYKPVITIASRYNDGTEVGTNYKFYRKYKGFKAICSTKRFADLWE